MSRVAGGFLGAALAGVGVVSAAPDLTDDVELGPSDLFDGEPSAAVLRGAASVGRDRGRGVFRSTCGIGIGGTNLSSLCATGIANGVKKPEAGDGAGGAACAWPDVAASASRERKILMVGNAFTLTISAPARDEIAAGLWAIVTIYGAIRRQRRCGTLTNYLLQCGERAR